VVILRFFLRQRKNLVNNGIELFKSACSTHFNNLRLEKEVLSLVRYWFDFKVNFYRNSIINV